MRALKEADQWWIEADKLDQNPIHLIPTQLRLRSILLFFIETKTKFIHTNPPRGFQRPVRYAAWPH